ncbi:MAG: DEAD/DEAH box helicase [Bacteroidia bacterium]
MIFSDFGFLPAIEEGLTSMGFQKPTPIQEQAIPVILQNKDLIACAQTGTGKTGAYLLPIMHKAEQDKSAGVNTLIIVPTRELAVQIDQMLEGFAYYTSLSSIAVYGGGDGLSFEREKKALIKGADIIIATPGRLIAHLGLGYTKFDTLKQLVLDEADRMLDMGFHDDIMKIVSYIPKERQTLLFSATFPPKIRQLATKLLHEPEQINIAVSKPAEGILQTAYLAYDAQKTALLKDLLNGKKIDSVIIFSSTKSNVKQLEKELQKLNFSCKAIHSDLEQNERESVMRQFKSRQIQVLVATDIVSRGIDIDGIGLVVNYDVPGDAEDYIHRIGRTARADSTGVAITFINEKDQQKFHNIETLIEKIIFKTPLPAHLGAAPIYDPSKKVFSDHKKHFQKRPQKTGLKK